MSQVRDLSGLLKKHGTVAHLVEHLHDSQGVGGSIPLGPTNLTDLYFRADQVDLAVPVDPSVHMDP